MSHPRFLHVANGNSTTMTIEAAGLPGALSIWADPLHDGPVPSGLADEELLEVRTRHLDPSTEPHSTNDLKEWRRAIADHGSYDELILWYEHDLFCQLNLIQLLSWIRTHVPSSKVVSLICIGSFPGRPDFKGLGELEPQELAPLIDVRQPVSDAQYTLAGRAWQAFREPTPRSLDELRRGDTAALPFLSAALVRFLEDYPWTTDGLSKTERRLLRLAEPGPLRLAAAFPLMHEGERAYYVTDTALLDLVEELSGTSPPLLAVTTSHRNLFERAVALTDSGRAVLRGELDRVALCGFDRWFGGVHLQHRLNMWRWDPDREQIAAESHPS